MPLPPLPPCLDGIGTSERGERRRRCRSYPHPRRTHPYAKRFPGACPVSRGRRAKRCRSSRRQSAEPDICARRRALRRPCQALERRHDVDRCAGFAGPDRRLGRGFLRIAAFCVYAKPEMPARIRPECGNRDAGPQPRPIACQGAWRPNELPGPYGYAAPKAPERAARMVSRSEASNWSRSASSPTTRSTSMSCPRLNLMRPTR